jgi:hypothetical protein
MRKTPKYLKRFSAIAAAMSASLVASSAMAAPTVAAEGAVVMSIQQVMEAINNGCQVSLVGPATASGELLAPYNREKGAADAKVAAKWDGAAAPAGPSSGPSPFYLAKVSNQSGGPAASIAVADCDRA